MALSFVNIPVPAGDAAGAGVNVAALGPNRTIVVSTGATFTGVLLIEASTNGVNWVPVARFDSTSQLRLPLSFACDQVRARRIKTTGGPAPTVNIGAEMAGAAVFGTLPLVAGGNGPGADVNVAAGGDLISVFTDGAFAREVFIEGSQDAGATHNRIEDFGKFEAARWQTVRRAAFNRLRTQTLRFRSGPDAPVVMFGSMAEASAAAGGALASRNYFANQLEVPTSDWPVTEVAPNDVDNITPSFVIAEYEEVAGQQGNQMRGFYQRVPAGATEWRPQIVWRSAAQVVGGTLIGWQFYYRPVPLQPTAVPAWASLPASQTAVPLGTTAWSYQDEGPFTIGNGAGQIDVTPGRDVLIGLIRTSIGEPPDVSGVVHVLEIQSEWF